MRSLSVATYAALRNKVEETLLLGQQRIEEAKVRTYHETGRLINEYLHRFEIPYQERGEQVVVKLAKDLGFGEKVFYRCLQFAEKFPKFAARRNLTWAHYRALFAVPDEKKRLALADEAAEGEWTSRDLEIEVRNLLWDERAAASDGKPPSLLPVPVLGPFFTYKIIAPESIHSRATEPLLDVGFSGTKKLTQFTSRKFPAGTIVTSIKDAKGRYSLRNIPSPRPLPRGEDKGEGALNAVLRTPYDALYTYHAFVKRVIDGDTLKLEIDTGFDDQKHETIRLRGIDCPEIDAPEGKAAKRFVEAQLAHCEFITIKSTQTRKEKWGRYLGDVFYKGKDGQQIYLNNLLLEKGYAVRVRE
jgi:endonuclease YncB( thermonuclease family)